MIDDLGLTDEEIAQRNKQRRQKVNEAMQKWREQNPDADPELIRRATKENKVSIENKEAAVMIWRGVGSVVSFVVIFVALNWLLNMDIKHDFTGTQAAIKERVDAETAVMEKQWRQEMAKAETEARVEADRIMRQITSLSR